MLEVKIGSKWHPRPRGTKSSKRKRGVLHEETAVASMKSPQLAAYKGSKKPDSYNLKFVVVFGPEPVLEHLQPDAAELARKRHRQGNSMLCTRTYRWPIGTGRTAENLLVFGMRFASDASSTGALMLAQYPFILGDLPGLCAIDFRGNLFFDFLLCIFQCRQCKSRPLSGSSSELIAFRRTASNEETTLKSV